MNNDPIAQRNFLALKQKSYAIKFDLEGTGYTANENIGAGAYGVVCSAIHEKTKKRVAIKKIPSIFEQITIAKRTYREIKILKHFKHDNVIAIQEILKPKGSLDQFKDVYIILDLMESDLHRIIHSSQPLTEEHVRFFTYQILRGLKYVHSANVIHRDLKPSNLLVNENCDLKIGDFGMARGVSTSTDDYNLVMTQYVATRWYRAPELMILPKETYSEAVDMWSVGCILAEMLGRKQLFPGRSHFDQLEKIIDKLGTPSSDYLKLTSSDIITGLILQKGQVKGVPWKDVYPKASKKVVDLLGRMLILDPKKRITVNQALQHPFLNKYHDPDDEPICIPVFNFDFERQNLETHHLKNAIIDEIMDYHKPKPAPRKTNFNFTPVPKAQLLTSPTGNKFNFRPVPKEEIEKQDKAKKSVIPSGSEQSQTSVQIQPYHAAVNSNQTETSKREGSKYGQDFVTNLLSSKDPKALLQNIVQQQASLKEDVFKKPEGVPLLVKVRESNNEETIKSSNEVEMLSAKSTGKVDSLSVKASQEESVDVEMTSAKNTAQDKGKDVAQESHSKPVDTKELIRMALLSNERKKQKEESLSKPKPVTALQRQREREEKRRQKLERMKQKKKKTSEKPSGLELTDEDKKLLQKWQSMQQKPKDSTEKQLTTKPSKPVAQPPTSTNPPSLKAVLPNVGTISEALKDTNIHLENNSNVSKPTEVAVKHHETSSLSGVPQTSQLPSTTTQASEAQQGYLTMYQNSLSEVLPQGEIGTAETNLPFGSYNWLETVSLDLSNEAKSVSSTASSRGAVDPSSKLPSYSEAIQSRSWPALSNSQAGSSLFGATRSDNLSQLQETQWLLSSLENPHPGESLPTAETQNQKPSDNLVPPDHLKTKVDSDMKIITKQLRHSLVEDLTLKSTPKGTGGGYGVTCDFDLLMESAGADGKPDSAQLSPSLFADWRELTGNMEPGEFENILQETMKSPISSQEFKNVMLSLMSPRSTSKVS